MSTPPRDPEARVLSAEEAGLSSEDEADLLDAVHEADRGEGTDGAEFFDQLRAELEALGRARRAG